jgi:Fe-S cluster assembly ATPase SufC
LTIEAIAAKENDLETLIALRQKLAQTLDESKSGRDIAALTRQLRFIMQEIEDLRMRDNDTDDVAAILADRNARPVRDTRGRRMDYDDEED